MHDDMQPDNMMQQPAGQEPIGAHGQTDREGAMAKADLYKLANYSLKLFKKMQDDDQLEGWVQAKITKAADYIASVYHYLEYEMEFSEYGAKLENSGIYNEDQKLEIKNKLMEARQKMAELKKIQASKITGKQVSESREMPCGECGGTGMITRQVPEELKSKVRAYNKKAKAMNAAISRVDRNKNGIPDALEKDQEELTDEDQTSLKKAGDSYKTSAGGTVTKTATGIKHERDPSSYDDGGDEVDSMSKSGKGKKSHAKAQSAAEKKERAPKLKQSPKSAKTWGMKDGEKFDNRDKEESTNETFGQGVYAEGEMTKAGKGVMKYGKDGMKALAKAGKEGKSLEPVKAKYNKYDEAALKGKQKKLDVDDDGDIEADDLADLRAGKKKDKQVDEAKPSAGLTKSQKSATVKDAKAGKDIGKPGKSFDKVAKAAGGGEKGEKIAAAAMWKNKAKALKENLDSMIPTDGISEADQNAQMGLQALIQYANQNDPQGLAQAMQQGAQAVQQYLSTMADKMTAGAGNAPAEPKDMPTTGDTEAEEGMVTDIATGVANQVGQQAGSLVKGAQQIGQNVKQFGTDVVNAATAGYQSTANPQSATMPKNMNNAETPDPKAPPQPNVRAGTSGMPAASQGDIRKTDNLMARQNAAQAALKVGAPRESIRESSEFDRIMEFKKRLVG